MHTVNFLKHLVEGYEVWAYALILFGIIFEGEFIIICTGILAYLGVLDVYTAFIFILCGGLGKTFLGYYIGVLVNRKWKDKKFIKYIERRVSFVMPHFDEKPFWSIFISKFILGVNHVVIIFSGFKKISLKIYLKAELITTAIWAPGFFSLGFFFGYTALSISKEIWRFSLVVLLLVIGFIIFDKLVGWIYELFELSYDDKQ